MSSARDAVERNRSAVHGESTRGPGLCRLRFPSLDNRISIDLIKKRGRTSHVTEDLTRLVAGVMVLCGAQFAVSRTLGASSRDASREFFAIPDRDDIPRNVDCVLDCAAQNPPGRAFDACVAGCGPESALSHSGWDRFHWFQWQSDRLFEYIFPLDLYLDPVDQSSDGLRSPSDEDR